MYLFFLFLICISHWITAFFTYTGKDFLIYRYHQMQLIYTSKTFLNCLIYACSSDTCNSSTTSGILVYLDLSWDFYCNLGMWLFSFSKLELSLNFWQNSYDQMKLWSFICFFTLKSCYQETISPPYKHNLVVLSEIS